MTQMTSREVRSVIVFWAIIAILIIGAFAADGLLREQTCTSAMVVDASTTIVYPEVCR